MKAIAVIGVGLMLATACSNYSSLTIPPDDVTNALQVGDSVEITRNDGSVTWLKLEEISEVEISGRLTTSILRRRETIPLTEISQIRTSVKEDGIDWDATAEGLGWAWGLVFWLVVL